MEKKEEFIEVRTVLAKKDSNRNTETEPMVINVKHIISFRTWHKGPNDTGIKGDMVKLDLSEGPVKMMLIEEHGGRSGFMQRLKQKAEVRELQ